MRKIILFRDKKECCGCGACMNICPKSAITMQEDSSGFVYPVIDSAKCVECGSCVNACGYQASNDLHQVRHVYAAANQNEASLKNSASGGVFAAIAAYVLDKGGVVYGVSMECTSGKLTPTHIRIDRKEDIVKLQGSKYVQSEIGYTYQEARKDLHAGKKVLFTGTPCQISGLYHFLNRSYTNLITADIICHGVPNRRFFQSFIDYYSNQLGGSIHQFYFRDKSKGQGMTTRTLYQTPDNTLKEKVKKGQLFAYYYFFLKAYTYRPNCYSCPFAAPDRVGDLTLGDFWGFQKEYPDCQVHISDRTGVSCLLLNTEKAVELLKNCSDSLFLIDADFEKASRHNKQLCMPSAYSARRDEILNLYNHQGYTAVDRYFHKYFKKDILKYTIADVMPANIKRMIKKLLFHND